MNNVRVTERAECIELAFQNCDVDADDEHDMPKGLAEKSQRNDEKRREREQALGYT